MRRPSCMPFSKFKLACVTADTRLLSAPTYCTRKLNATERNSMTIDVAMITKSCCLSRGVSWATLTPTTRDKGKLRLKVTMSSNIPPDKRNTNTA